MHIYPEIVDAVTALLASKPGEWPAMVRSQPKLLSADAEELLRQALSNIPRGASPDQVAKVGDAYGLVKRSRDLGVAAALAELDLKVRRPRELAETLRKLDFVPEAGADPDERVGLYERALGLLEPGDDAILRARLQVNLGAYLTKAESGDPSNNLERAIDVLQDATDVFTESGFPERWAAVQANLANAFVLRHKGTRLQNLARADEYFGRALSVFTQATHPAQWASLTQSRALAQEMRVAAGGGSIG
jgi:tetratricopeptide (TPR) repeat protein